jgi:hypothetical protein
MKEYSKPTHQNKDAHRNHEYDFSHRQRIYLTLSFFLPILIYVLEEYFSWRQLAPNSTPILPTIYIILTAVIISVGLGFFKRRLIVTALNVAFLLVFFIPSSNKEMHEIIAIPLEAYTGISVSSSSFITLKLAFICLSSIFLSACILIVLLIATSHAMLSRMKIFATLFLVACAIAVMAINIILSSNESRYYFLISHLIFCILVISSFLSARVNSILKIFPPGARLAHSAAV